MAVTDKPAHAHDNTEAPTCHGGLENLDTEHAYWVNDVIDGAVPTDLEGTFLRNGPGRQRIGGQAYGHWFDGDGMLCAFSFVDGRVHFKNRYVRTPKYLEETAAQKILYRGFGTQLPGGVRANAFRQPGNPANTNSVIHGGKLLALWEGGRPWELDPATLDTVGECNYEGQLTKANVFSAHPKIHQRSGDMFNFGGGIGGMTRRGPQAVMNVFRISRSGKLFKKGKVPVPTFPFAHDFAISDRYAIFFVGSIVSNGMGDVILGKTSISEQTQFDGSIPLRIIVADLDTFEIVNTFETDPGAIIHTGNAYEDGDELVVDGMYASDFEANEGLSDVFNSTRFKAGTFHRYRLNLVTGELRHEVPSPHESEFPTFNPTTGGTRNRYTYTACNVPNGADSFFNGFQKVSDDDADLVALPPGYFGSEPIFAPAGDRETEDRGYVLEVVYNAFDHVSELHIHRGEQIGDRVCALRLQHHIPHQFHGHWHDQVVLTEVAAR